MQPRSSLSEITNEWYTLFELKNQKFLRHALLIYAPVDMIDESYLHYFCVVVLMNDHVYPQVMTTLTVSIDTILYSQMFPFKACFFQPSYISRNLLLYLLSSLVDCGQSCVYRCIYIIFKSHCSDMYILISELPPVTASYSTLLSFSWTILVNPFLIINFGFPKASKDSVKVSSI